MVYLSRVNRLIGLAYQRRAEGSPPFRFRKETGRRSNAAYSQTNRATPAQIPSFTYLDLKFRRGMQTSTDLRFADGHKNLRKRYLKKIGRLELK